MELAFGILGAAALLFVSGRVRLDVVALLTVLALILGGILTPREALAGFGDPVVVLVAALLVVGETLTRTGIAYALGGWMMRTAGTSEARLLVLLMAVPATLGSVMSSTAVVAIFIPVVLTLSVRGSLNASRLLMPLSFAALISGMLTLIATTPNLVVSAELGQRGYEPFAFFSFLPVGSAVLIVGIVYMLLVGRHLLPGAADQAPKSESRTVDDLMRLYGLEGRRHRLRVPLGSPLVACQLANSGLGTSGLRVLGIERAGRFGAERIPAPGPSFEIHPDDVLVGVGEPARVDALVAEHGLQRLPIQSQDAERWRQEFGVAVVLVHPESSLLGHTLLESGFRSRHGIHVLGLRRAGECVEDYENVPLAASDSLLVNGPWSRIALLQAESHDFVVLALPAELKDVAPARRRAPLALAILAAMIAASALEIVPVVVAVLMAALATVLTRCLSMEDAYRSIHWSSIVLIAGMLPVADALQKTGGIDAVVELLLAGLGDAGPYVMMSILFAMTAALGLALSNTATAVLMAPIAIRAAESLAVSPRPFAMMVVIAASAAFVTPVSTPVVTLVVEPGGYRFLDFVKVGTPLLLVTWAVTLALVPLFFPL